MPDASVLLLVPDHDGEDDLGWKLMNATRKAEAESVLPVAGPVLAVPWP